MDFYGNINLRNHLVSNLGLQTEADFPATPVAGRLVFKDMRVYICVDNVGSPSIPLWVPLTNKIDTYIHTQDTSSSTWTIEHNLNVSSPLVQVYDADMSMLTPTSVDAVDNNTLTITLSGPSTGRAVVMFGQPDFGGGVITPPPQEFVWTQTTSSTTWVIIHGLGYYPAVRAYRASDGQEILPADVVHDSVFQTTVTFSSAQTGTARLV